MRQQKQQQRTKACQCLWRRRSLSVFVRPVGLCWGSAPVATALHAKYFAATEPKLWSALKVPGTSIMRASRTLAGSSSRSNLEGQKRRGKEIQTKLLSIWSTQTAQHARGHFASCGASNICPGQRSAFRSAATRTQKRSKQASQRAPYTRRTRRARSRPRPRSNPEASATAQSRRARSRGWRP